MGETQSRTAEEEQHRKTEARRDPYGVSGGPGSGTGDLACALSLLPRSGARGRSNSTSRADALHRMQGTYGNRAVQRSMQQAWPSKYTGAYTPAPEEGIWERAKKLLGVDQIGPGIEKIVGKAKSGYEWAEKKAFGLFGGNDGGSPSHVENAPTSPGYNYGGGGVSNYSITPAWPSKSYMLPEADEEGY